MIKLPAETTSLDEATLLLLWPYEGLGRYQELLPRNASIEAHGGPLAQGDLEKSPYEAYVAFAATPLAERPGSYLARFGDQIALVDYTLEVDEEKWQVQLTWEALAPPAENYTVFVHLRDGGKVVAQDDGGPATGHYPTSLWRKGDLILDTHTLQPPEGQESECSLAGSPAGSLAVGLYVWPTMEHLEAKSPTGEPLGNELILPCQTNN